MVVNTRSLLLGRENRTLDWIVLVGGLFVLVVGTYVIGVLLGGSAFQGSTHDGIPVYARALDPTIRGLFVALIYGGPAVVSALSAYYRGGVLRSLVLGVTPGVAVIATELFGPVFLGAAPGNEVGYYLVAYSVYGIAGALLGFVVGTIGQWATDRIR